MLVMQRVSSRLQLSWVKRQRHPAAVAVPLNKVLSRQFAIRPLSVAGHRTPLTAAPGLKKAHQPNPISAAAGRHQVPGAAVGAGRPSFRTVSAPLESTHMAEEQEHQQQEVVQQGILKDAEIMSEAYGQGYATRSSDEGFGQIYTETVKVHKPLEDGQLDSPARGTHVVSLSKVGDDELKDECDDEPGTIPADFDTTQGSPCAQKEHGRHSLKEDACEDGDDAKNKAKAGHAGLSM